MSFKKSLTLLLGGVLLTAGLLHAQEDNNMQPANNNFILHQQCINSNGDTIYEGDVTSQYNASDNGCDIQQRECNQGVLQGDNAYQHNECVSLIGERNNCERNGNVVPEFSSIVAYKDSVVTRDMTCSFVQKICVGGQLVGSADFTETSCQFSNEFSGLYQETNSDSYDRFGNIKPEALLLPPLGKGNSCTTPRGETIPSGQTVLSFEQQFGSFQGVCEYKISLCSDGKFDQAPMEFKSCIQRNPDNSQARKSNEEVASLESQLRTCLDNRNEAVALIEDYEEQLRVCDPDFVPTPLSFDTASIDLPYDNKEPCERHGETLNHGDSVVAYQDGYREGDNYICPEENRTCIDGELSGTFTLKTCNNPGRGPHRCPKPRGGAITHGDDVIAYQNPSVVFPNECESEVRTCEFGNLLGSNQFETCKVIGDTCTTSQGNTVEHGESILTYLRNSVPYSESCGDYSALSKCVNGSLQGGYNYESCGVADPKPCNFNGGSIPHGSIVTRYQFDTVYGQPTDGVDQCPREMRTCDNGSLINSNGVAAPFSFSYNNCEVVPPGNNVN